MPTPALVPPPAVRTAAAPAIRQPVARMPAALSLYHGCAFPCSCSSTRGSLLCAMSAAPWHCVNSSTRAQDRLALRRCTLNLRCVRRGPTASPRALAWRRSKRLPLEWGASGGALAGAVLHEAASGVCGVRWPPPSASLGALVLAVLDALGCHHSGLPANAPMRAESGWLPAGSCCCRLRGGLPISSGPDALAFRAEEAEEVPHDLLVGRSLGSHLLPD